MSGPAAPVQTETNPADRSLMRAFRRLWRSASPAVQEQIREMAGPAVLTRHQMRVAWRAAPTEVRTEARRLVADSLETEEDFGAVYTRLPASVRRAHERDVRLRTAGRKRRQDAPRKPSGFTAPRHLSTALCTFLGVDAGTELSGSEVTHRIADYIKAHNLGEGRLIHADAKLQELLHVPEGVVLSWFNLQHYLKTHLTRGQAVVVV